MTLHWGPYLSLNTWPSHLEDHYSLLNPPGYKVIGGYSSNDMIVVLFRLGQWYYPEQWLLLPFAYLFFRTTVEASAIVAMAIMHIIFSVSVKWCESSEAITPFLRIQPAVNQVDEYGALIYAGRWGIHGITLPGRVTFSPGNVGFSTFGAPRPMEVCEKSITVELCYAFILHHTAK